MAEGERERLVRKEVMTVDNAIEQGGFGRAQIRYILAASFVFLTEVILLVSGSILLPSMICEWKLPRHYVLALMLGNHVSFMFGGYIGGKLGDVYGRRKTILWGQGLQILLTTVSLTQTDFKLFLALRSLASVSFGLIMPCTTTIALETSPRNARFLVKLFLGIAGTLGGTVSSVVAMMFLEDYGWRNVTGMLTAPCLVPILLFCMLDESPRFLFLTGDHAGGTEVIKRMYKQNNCEEFVHNIKNRMDNERGLIKHLFSPEFETTTCILIAVFVVKGFITSTIHLSLPYLMQGTYCNDNTTTSVYDKQHVKECGNLSSSHIEMLMWGHLIGIVIVIVVLTSSQLLGRRRAAAAGYLLTGLCLLSAVLCQGKALLAIKSTVSLSFNHASTAVIILFVTEIYPTSSRALALGFFWTVGHIVSLFGPFMAVYLVVGKEFEFFLGGAVLFFVCGALVMRINHETYNEPMRESIKEYDLPDSDWDIDYDVN